MKIGKDVYLVGAGDFGMSNSVDCHVYLVDAGRKKFLVDAGCGLDTQDIVKNISADGFDPRKDIDLILVTHAHSDHAGGAANLKRVTGAELYAPSGEAEFIEKGGEDLDYGLRVTKKSGVYPKDYEYAHTKVERVLKNKERLRIGKFTVRVVQLPGHSHGIAGYLIEEEPRSFFSGDIVFIDGTVGFGNWPGCNLDNYRNNIVRLKGLKVTRLFPGHFGWTLRDGQRHLDAAVENFKGAWLPPAWTEHHVFR